MIWPNSPNRIRLREVLTKNNLPHIGKQLAIVGKDVCKLSLRICRKEALSSTINTLSLFIFLGLEFGELYFSLYLRFSFRSILEVNKVSYVFREKKQCIFWPPIGNRLKCCIVGDFQESLFQEGGVEKEDYRFFKLIQKNLSRIQIFVLSLGYRYAPCPTCSVFAICWTVRRALPLPDY